MFLTTAQTHCIMVNTGTVQQVNTHSTKIQCISHSRKRHFVPPVLFTVAGYSQALK